MVVIDRMGKKAKSNKLIYAQDGIYSVNWYDMLIFPWIRSHHHRMRTKKFFFCYSMQQQQQQLNDEIEYRKI